MNLEQYIDAVKATLANSPIIASIEVIDERILLGRGYFRARLTLMGTSINCLTANPKSLKPLESCKLLVI